MGDNNNRNKDLEGNQDSEPIFIDEPEDIIEPEEEKKVYDLSKKLLTKFYQSFHLLPEVKEKLVEAQGSPEFITNLLKLARKTILEYWNELEPDEKNVVKEDKDDFILGLASMAAGNFGLFSKQLMKKFTEREGLSDQAKERLDFQGFGFTDSKKKEL